MEPITARPVTPIWAVAVFESDELMSCLSVGHLNADFNSGVDGIYGDNENTVAQGVSALQRSCFPIRG
ncbi:hypothetical protein GCM10027213_35840 [Mycobacterium bourgelatii]